MKVIVLGSTGMIGKGVLIECLEHKRIERVLIINRQPLNMRHEKLTEVIHKDFRDFSGFKEQLELYDACFFCLGISSVGMAEERYREITFDLTLNFAQAMLAANPRAVFCYVSGAGTDSSEKGKIMWARIKGRTENALLKLPFGDSYMFRPGYLQPRKGVQPKTGFLKVMYTAFKPLYYLLRPFPGMVTDTGTFGKAMINAALMGYDRKILEVRDINTLAEK